MCGIAGYVLTDSLDPLVIERMTDVLAHRGPDGRGTFISARHGIALGHRRLSIIDLEGGVQPMHSRCGRYAIVFNGEIYNHVELRRELEIDGAKFVTQSDTEVLLKLYRRDGAAMCERLNGMFALAIADLREGVLFLARDAMGEKPLYYCCVGGHFAFASEVKSLLEFPGVSRRVDPAALDSFLSLNYVPGERCMIDGIHRLPAGCTMMVRRGRPEVSRYWHLPAANPAMNESRRNWRDALDEFDELLDDAVRLRLRSDVPVGVFLSSGVDTSLIASSLARIDRLDVTAFSASFDDGDYDESADAAKLASQIGLRFIIDRAHADPVSLPADIVEFADDPMADSSAIPMGQICKVASRHVKVVLGGDGADELFGGYLTHRASLLANHFRKLPSFVRDMMRRGAELLPRGRGKVPFSYKLRRFFERSQLPGGAAHLAWNGSWMDDEKSSLYSVDWRRRLHQSRNYEQLARDLNLHGDSIGIRDMLAADQGQYLPNDILVKTDRMSMAHGLEARSPFLDRRIVEFAASLHPRMLASLRQGKLLLRAAAVRRGMRNIARRKKQGFSVPIHAWLRGTLRESMHEWLAPARLDRAGIFDSKAVQERISAHLSGRRDIGFELWGLMVFMAWHDRFILGSGRPIASGHRMQNSALGLQLSSTSHAGQGLRTSSIGD